MQTTAQPKMPAQPQAPQQGPVMEEVEASPEEQAQFDSALTAALGPVSDSPEMFASMVQALESGGQMPDQNIARITLALMDAAEAKAGPIENDDLREALAETIISELVETSVNLGALKESDVSDDFAASTYMSFAIMWAEAHPDRLDDEDKATLAELQAQRQGAAGDPQKPQPQPQSGLLSQPPRS